jgi:hypothetical protein
MRAAADSQARRRFWQGEVTARSSIVKILERAP